MGYSISAVQVDGASVGAVSSYSFSNVTANHTISATFAVITYTISATAGTGGSISPPGTTTVNYNGSQTYTITPLLGYSISAVQVDGASVGAVSSYSFSNVTANHTISAAFVVTTYTISATAGSGGSISPPGTTTVNYSGSQTYTITPLSGYSIYSVQVDGVSVGGVISYAFINVTANHTIAATFVATTSQATSFATNAGGGQYTSQSSGIVFQADADYSGGSTSSTTAAITGTPDSTLYQTERFGNFSYNIPLEWKLYRNTEVC